MKILNAVPAEGELLDFDFRLLTFNPDDGIVMRIGVCVQRPDDDEKHNELQPDSAE